MIENNVEQCKITSTNTPTRSESAQSLDFKPTSRQEKERLENSIQVSSVMSIFNRVQLSGFIWILQSGVEGSEHFLKQAAINI